VTTEQSPETNDETQEASSSGSLEGRIVAERYRVEKLLGEGGMGAVYRAEHIHMRKIVALKVLHPEMCSVTEVVARFEREAVAAGRITHPNVATATDFGRLENGSFFLVLEYAAGRDLRALINAIGALDPERCAHIARQVAEALGAAHALTIVHRDLKPDNVMLIERDGDPDFVKVLDFGIAKVTFGDLADQPALTRTGAVFGTPDYMSPEQALGQPVDHRSDLYALGILMFEMLSGSTPFDHDDPTMVLAHQITAPPPPLPEHVPAPLASLVMSLLAKDVQQRPQTAAEVVQALDRMRRDAAGEAPRSASMHDAPRSASMHDAPRSGSMHDAPRSGSMHDAPASGFVATALAILPPKQSPEEVAAVSVPQGSARLGERGASPLIALGRDAQQVMDKLAPMLREPVTLGTTKVPTWSIAAAVGGLGVLVLLIGTLVSVAAIASSDPVPVASSGVIPALNLSPIAAPGSARPVATAELERIEQTPVYKRNIDDWVALARGYASLNRHRDSALAYRSVLQLERSRRNDPQLLADLRRAAMDPDAYSLVVNLAEGRAGLGETGIDLLWDIWNDLRSTDQDGQAEAALKKLVILSRRASKPLRVAIELNATDRCEKLAEVVGRAEKVADRRSLARLEHIEAKSQCKEEGCFPCLAGSQSLARAKSRAKSRAAPAMTKGYR
jgi:serine/threonine-protein kinase